jgi:hypothetical protein
MCEDNFDVDRIDRYHEQLAGAAAVVVVVDQI